MVFSGAEEWLGECPMKKVILTLRNKRVFADHTEQKQ